MNFHVSDPRMTLRNLGSVDSLSRGIWNRREEDLSRYANGAC